MYVDHQKRNCRSESCGANTWFVGTHNIFIAEIVEISTRKDGYALLYFDRG